LKTKISNLRELSSTKARRFALDILEHGLEAADPYIPVLEALAGIEELRSGRYGKVYVIGFGKAAYRMALACEKFFGEDLTAGVIIVPTGSIEERKSRLNKIRVLLGEHPIPTQRNVASAQQLLETIKDLNRNDLVVCLISGGGSALFTLPANGITLDDIKDVTKLLLEAGSDIKELNAVRKHISSVAGGQLSLRIYPAHCISLILSDVVGNDPSVIASGPTYADPSSYSDALEILEKYDVAVMGGVPNVERHLRRGMAGGIPETPKPGSGTFSKTRNVIVADNARALLSMNNRAEKLGLGSAIVTSKLEGEARDAGSMIGALAKRKRWRRPQTQAGMLPLPPCALIFGGETTVAVKGKTGRGGRNQEVALSAALYLEGLGEAAFASMGSDGIDGNTASAGAIVDSSTAAYALSLGLSPVTFLERNDSNTLFKKIGGCLICTGPTGTNVNDLAVLILL